MAANPIEHRAHKTYGMREMLPRSREKRTRRDVGFRCHAAKLTLRRIDRDDYRSSKMSNSSELRVSAFKIFAISCRAASFSAGVFDATQSLGTTIL